MWYLMKKFSLMYVLYAALYAGLLFPLLNYDRITGSNPQDPIYIFYQGSFIFWVVLGSLWALEQMEHKARGYGFLRTLPLRIQDIVRAKFSLVLLAVLFIVVFQAGSIRLLTKDRDLTSTTWNFSMVIGSLCLILAGLAYAGIFRFGFSRFSKWIFGAWLLFFLYPVILREFLMPAFRLSVDDVLDRVTGFNWILVSTAALTIFWALMQLAVRLWREERI